MKYIKDYLHLYLGCRCMTPDGIGELVGLPYQIKQREVVSIHFGKMVKTKNSIDGGYDKTRNHGAYSIHVQRLEPIGSKGYTSDGIDIPGGIKPILRPLSDMTEEEAIQIAEIVIGSFDSVKFIAFKKLDSKGNFFYWDVNKKHRGFSKSLTIDERGEIEVYDGDDIDQYMKQHEVTKFLLSKGFDLFGLIEAGLAIDKTKL